MNIRLRLDKLKDTKKPLDIKYIEKKDKELKLLDGKSDKICFKK